LGLPQSIRFRVLSDAKGQSRLAFGPVMVPGNTGIVRVSLHPSVEDGSQSSQRVGVETLEVLWSDYKKAPVAIFTLDEIVADPLGGE